MLQKLLNVIKIFGVTILMSFLFMAQEMNDTSYYHLVALKYLHVDSTQLVGITILAHLTVNFSVVAICVILRNIPGTKDLREASGVLCLYFVIMFEVF